MNTIDSIVIPYLLVAILWAVIVFFVVSISVMFIGLGFHKRSLARRDQTYRRQTAAYRDAIARIAYGDAVTLPPVADFVSACGLGEAVTQICREQSVLPSPAVLEAIQKSGAVTLVVTHLVNKDWGQRFLAVGALGDFRLPERFDTISEFARSESHMLVFGNCLYAAANCVSQPDQIQTLFGLIHSQRDTSSGYDEGMFRLAFHALRARNTPPEAIANTLRLCLLSPTAAEPHLLSLVQAIGKEKLVTFKDELVLIVRRLNSPRLLSAAMRAIHNMGLCDDVILEHIGSSDAMLNITAIRSVTCCGRDASFLIGRQLQSPDFNVRYAAAVTLKKLGESGHKELLNRRIGSDPYARNMATFALTSE